jgi:hypothetical protein
VSRAIGGYVRRKDRKHQPRGLHLSGPPRWEMEMFYQCMPLLRFEQFNVMNDVDTDDKPGIGSSYGQRSRHHPGRS